MAAKAKEVSDECIYKVIGGEPSMKKLMETFFTKLEDSELKPIFEGNDQHQGIKSLEDSLKFDHILEEAFKDRESFPGVKNAYQIFKISDEDFDNLVSLLKKSMIGSKLFKLP